MRVHPQQDLVGKLISGRCSRLPEGAVDIILDIGFIAYAIYALATGGRKDLGMNLAALGADIGGLFIPFATGLGTASRAARGGQKLLPSVPRLAQGNLKMGLEHIVYHHWHSSGFAHAYRD